MALNPPIRDWRGRRVWVLGASSGIGAEVSALLLERGARVAVSARSQQRLRERFGGDTLVVPADVTDAESLSAAAAEIAAARDGIDLTLNFAGTYQEMRPWAMDLAAVRAIVELNLTGAFNLLEALQPHLKPGTGLGLVASVAGYGGLPNSLAYGASKAGLINLAQSLWLDYRARNVAVYLINPGFVETPLTAKNRFPMPFIIPAEDAAHRTVAGLERGNFEIDYPRRFTRLLKLLNLLPQGLYFRCVRRFTGI
ncbi:MAG: SDR family NAD(P)-dependent oxidoreductase [Burkholderiales bacterium]